MIKAQPFQITGSDMAVLAIKDYTYERGDKIVVEVQGTSVIM